MLAQTKPEALLSTIEREVFEFKIKMVLGVSFSASQSVKMRLDAGEIVKCFATRDSWDGNAGIRINLFGYLIDYP